MKKKIKRIKGFRDFYPNDWTYIKWIEGKMVNAGSKFGFEEYEGPIVESIDLYTDKTSEEIVQKQTFIINDRGNERMILRPELTPTLARMVVDKENELVFPIKWQSFGRFFRYEKPQRGRGRSFFQWNVDIIGTESPLADAELIVVAVELLKSLGLTSNDVRIKLNDRHAFEKLLIETFSLNQEEVIQVIRLIDKIDKLNDDDFNKELSKIKQTIKREDLNKILAIKEPSFSSRLVEILDSLKEFEILDWVELDLTIVRGFDYYTSTVMEAWATTENLRRALFGGGRYDNLTQVIGGKNKLPGIGFAAGDMALSELLTELNLKPENNQTNKSIAIVLMDEFASKSAIKFANNLRKIDLCVDVFYEASRKVGKLLTKVNKKNIQYVMIIGENEIKTNNYILKDMDKGEQHTISGFDVNEIKRIIS